MTSRREFPIGLLLFTAMLIVSCAGEQGPEGPPGPQGAEGPAGPMGPEGTAPEFMLEDLGCIECHNEQTLLFSKRVQWEQSTHATGGQYVRGASATCAGCHASEGFTVRIADGLHPDELEQGFDSPSPINCRTCHQIHTTYTGQDYALESTGPVDLYQAGGTYDAGLSNQCAGCHQPFNAFPGATNGEVEITSTRFGPHHGAEASTLIGTGGALIEGSPSVHYALVQEGCIGCHMGPEADHRMSSQVSRCHDCHGGIEDFDYNGAQTEIRSMVEEVGALLLSRGLIDEEGRSVPGTYPESEAAALWNYKVVLEDQSFGVHNANFARALLEQALEALR